MRAAHLELSVGLPVGSRNDVQGGGDAYGLHHWDLSWSSLWGHEALYCVWGTHAACATGTIGRSPTGATKR
eukprot:6224505-Pyramimonas_sp.AAC.1